MISVSENGTGTRFVYIAVALGHSRGVILVGEFVRQVLTG